MFVGLPISSITQKAVDICSGKFVGRIRFDVVDHIFRVIVMLSLLMKLC